jgi:hypothetical protein
MEAVSKDKLFQIFGTEQLVKLFQELDFKNQNKILSVSFKKASKIIIDQARSNLKGQYGHVYRSLTASFRRDIQTLEVGASRRLGGNLAHIANAGTKERHYINKDGNVHRTGKITPNYFWDNAISKTEGSVEEEIYKNIREQFEKLIQKNNRIK